MKKIILLTLTVIFLSSVISQAKPMPDFIDGWPQPAIKKLCKKCLTKNHIKKIKEASNVKLIISGKSKQKHTVNLKKRVSK
jgi:hypothetical protein